MNRRDFLLFGALGGISTIQASTQIFSTPTCVYPKDVILNHEEMNVLFALRDKLKRVQKFVGFGNFNYVDFETVLKYAKNVSIIGEFTKVELEMLDRLFYDDPKKYGFYGAQTTKDITTKIAEKDIVKIPGTGHYIFNGKPMEDYNRLLKDVARDITLTSGVRGVPKQMYLYISKILASEGNISYASKIIAPPAYTYHAISDFDVGKKGFGVANFTEQFTTTDEYKELIKLDYISIRYKKNNKDGVRYEPWHIEVI